MYSIPSGAVGTRRNGSPPSLRRDHHFDTEELDDGDEKEQRHSFDLKKSKFTNLFLDAAHMGVGGENSWGAWPLEKYRIHYGNKTFNFVLIPQTK